MMANSYKMDTANYNAPYNRGGVRIDDRSNTT